MNSSIIIGYSFLTALLLILYVIVYNIFFSSNPVMMMGIVYWLSYLTYAYFVNFGVNAAVKYTSCSTVDIGQTAINSIWVPIFSVVFLGISSIGFFKNAIMNAVPGGGSDLSVKIYYMFWAGIFGQMLSGGFSSACK